MKKTIVTSLLILLSASAPALNFFGIEHSENPADHLINLIYSLSSGNEEEATVYYDKLQSDGSGLAAGLLIDDLKIPCSRCRGEGTLSSGALCSLCKGAKQVADPHALGYLQHKFCEAIDAGRSNKTAWKKAKAAFDKRRAIVLSKEALFGTIIRKEDGGLLLSRQRGNETVYIKGLSVAVSSKGTPINGYVWPDGTYTCQGKDGSPVEVKRYTATLWMD